MKSPVVIMCAAACCCVLALCGCKSDRTKDLELNGMFTQADTGTLAVGSIELQAAPSAAESLSLKMWWTSPFLAPSAVRPCARLMMSGTNTCAQASNVVDAVTRAIGINFFCGTNATAFCGTNATVKAGL